MRDGFWISEIRACDQAGKEYRADRGAIGNRSNDLRVFFLASRRRVGRQDAGHDRVRFFEVV
jgi:hypothetical protein